MLDDKQKKPVNPLLLPQTMAAMTSGENKYEKKANLLDRRGQTK